MQTDEVRVVLKHFLQTMRLQIIYKMYKEDFVLNNLQWLMCDKTKPNQTKPNIVE